MSDNTITLAGNITRDPEVRYTTTGKPVATFGLAVNRRYQTGGEWQEDTSFFDITAWGPLAENASASLVKGNRVVVTGRMDQKHWETDDGDKRHKLEVVATDIGASLRFAQAELTKTTRTTNDTTAGGDEEEPEEAF